MELIIILVILACIHPIIAIVVLVIPLTLIALITHPIIFIVGVVIVLLVKYIIERIRE